MGRPTPGEGYNDNGHVQDKVKHSGIHHDEYPVDEFDKTTLKDAVDEGIVGNVPDSPEGINYPVSTEPVTRGHRAEKKSFLRNRYVQVGGAVAAIAAIGGAYLANSGGNSEQKSSTPEKSPSTSAPVVPGEASSSAAAPTAEKTADSGETLIANVTGPATKEQIQYVLNNPVTEKEFPTVEQQVKAIGVRWNVMLHSVEVDYDKTTDPDAPIYVPGTLDQLDTLLKSLTDIDNEDEYDVVRTSALKRASAYSITAADDKLRYGKLYSKNQIQFIPTGSAVQTGAGEGMTFNKVPINIIYTSNDVDERFHEDYAGSATVKRDVDGTVKISKVVNDGSIGDIQ